MESVLGGFEDVLQLLDSPVLRTEIRVLYEVLYVYNNSLRHHKPFRSIKQVCVVHTSVFITPSSQHMVHEAGFFPFCFIDGAAVPFWSLDP